MMILHQASLGRRLGSLACSAGRMRGRMRGSQRDDRDPLREEPRRHGSRAVERNQHRATDHKEAPTECVATVGNGAQATATRCIGVLLQRRKSRGLSRRSRPASLQQPRLFLLHPSKAESG
jgi:hypothetical protein